MHDDEIWPTLAVIPTLRGVFMTARGRGWGPAVTGAGAAIYAAYCLWPIAFGLPGHGGPGRDGPADGNGGPGARP